ncbi:hypothetical protein PHYPO_G00006030 [Pangasianodon hypophthalmus]|uniref:Uncharacterized protein n=1 Tax=Pangasianodon hypophthalmus TaxID=310915 RepID=A0A5N5Q4A8_PANHP|nr:hypothetical protein PHYPO_G00006030 [Pangasianodon hypophthalmus]
MKVVWALIFLAGCALLVVAFQAMQQEIDIHRMRKLIILNTEDVKTKEDEILSSKGAMQKLTKELVPLDNQKNQLTKKMEELGKQKESSEQNLNTCRTQKTDAEQKKTERTSAINTLKTNQNAEIQKVQEEIQSLQKQILDRDTKICSYVDKEREEGRTLCEDKMAASKQ